MITYAQNFEDVMLARAFKGKTDGFYIDVGAMDPVIDSVTAHFYGLGWSGINVEPVDAHFGQLERARPRDINLPVAVGRQAGRLQFFEVPDSGLSSLVAPTTERNVIARDVEVVTLKDIFASHVQGRTVDFLKIDVEGAEADVIAGNDWASWRPRIVVVEATAPNSPEGTWGEWEPALLASGYLFAYFDGLNRFYVRQEDSNLLSAFATPPNVFDDFTPRVAADLNERVTTLNEEYVRLRVIADEALGDRNRLRDEYDRLSEMARAVDADRTKLFAEYTTVTDMARETAAALEATRHEYAKLTDLTLRSEEERNALREEYGKLKDLAEGALSERETLRTEYVKLEALARDVMAERDGLRGEYEKLQTLAQDALADRDSLRGEYEKLQALAETALREHALLQDEYGKLQALANAALEDRNRLGQEYEALRQAAQAKDVRLLAVEADLARISGEIAQLRPALSASEDDRREFEQRSVNLTRELNAIYRSRKWRFVSAFG